MLSLIQPAWTAPDNVFAYTTTRAGGVSEGRYRGLNVGAHVGDALSAVEANRALLPDSEKIVWLQQVHGHRSVHLDTLSTKQASGLPLEADAAISSASTHTCAVMTADCVPILLCNNQGSEVAAIHAGWQGLANGIIGKTIKAMQSPSMSLLAWIGPAISQSCYEVPQSLAEKFAAFPEAIRYAPSRDKCLLDLPLIAAQQLKASGVEDVTQSGLCTYSDSKRFYSHRRATHEGRAQTGRIVSVIGLR